VTALLSHIETHLDLKKITKDKLPELCVELRQFLIDTILENGGHFAANLGVVELTVALHHQLNLPNDQLIWDVGHQSYAHKVLTGRKNDLKNIRKTGGISGFPSLAESEFDAFGTGHSSTSISAILGIAEADKLSKKARQHIAIIGDGALTAGQSFEALNHLAESGLNVLVIINDNQMSIDANNSNMARILKDTTTAQVYFETMGLSYSFCEKGNDFESVYNAIAANLHQKAPRILHLKTKKGFGFDAAEKDHIRWHATESTVKVLPELHHNSNFPKYQEVAGNTMVELAKLDDKVVVVTPAMPTGSGLKAFEKQFPDRFFDVGIAEQHAVTFSAGLAKEGYRVFCFIYSTFLQRAYDQLIHDVCLQNLPVVFCIDRAGLVGGDGATHHGAFDLAYLKPIPNIDIIAPKDVLQLRNALFTGLKNTKNPIAIRYPRGRGEFAKYNADFSILEKGKAEIMQKGSNTAIISIGNCWADVQTFLDNNTEKDFNPTVVNLIYVKPLDTTLLNEIFANHTQIITIENGSIKGGIGEEIAALSIAQGFHNIEFKHLGISDHFVTHGSTGDLKNGEGWFRLRSTTPFKPPE